MRRHCNCKPVTPPKIKHPKIKELFRNQDRVLGTHGRMLETIYSRAGTTNEQIRRLEDGQKTISADTDVIGMMVIISIIIGLLNLAIQARIWWLS